MAEAVLEAFGRRIRELRKARGLSQEGFAREVGLDRAYMGRMERGTQNPTLVTLARMATTLEIDLGEFVRDLPTAGRGDG